MRREMKRYLRELVRGVNAALRRRGLSPLPPPTSERLIAFLNSADIKLLDVGARGGPPDLFHAFAPYTRLVICEPDPIEIKRVQDKLVAAGVWREVTVIPEALFSKWGRMELNIARHEGLSSLLNFNRSEIKKFHCIKKWGDIVERIPVTAETLDRIAEQYHLRDVSVIKLDTQGTELDILKSGQRLVLPSVVAVYVEMEFIPIYEGQPLFSDVHRFLESEGFHLADIKRTVLRRTTKQYLAYSKPEIAWAHGIYFRERTAQGNSLPPEALVRRSVAAAILEFFDYAVQTLESPEVERYLAARGFTDIPRNLALWSVECLRFLKRRHRWFSFRDTSGSIWSDKHVER